MKKTTKKYRPTNRAVYVYGKMFSRGDEWTIRLRVEPEDIKTASKLNRKSVAFEEKRVADRIKVEKGERAVIHFVKNGQTKKVVHYDDSHDNELDQFYFGMRDKYGKDSHAPMFLSDLANECTDVIKVSGKRGFGFRTEEADYGVGPTKDDARLAYTRIADDSDDDDWF